MSRFWFCKREILCGSSFPSVGGSLVFSAVGGVSHCLVVFAYPWMWCRYLFWHINKTYLSELCQAESWVSSVHIFCWSRKVCQCVCEHGWLKKSSCSDSWLPCVNFPPNWRGMISRYQRAHLPHSLFLHCFLPLYISLFSNLYIVFWWFLSSGHRFHDVVSVEG